MPINRKIPRIFSSYAREDYKLAAEIKSCLNGYDVDVWMDVANIHPSDNWVHKTFIALDESDYVLALISKNSVSADGFVTEEFYQSVQLHTKGLLKLIPVLLDDSDMPNGMNGISGIIWKNSGRAQLHTEFKGIAIKPKRYTVPLWLFCIAIVTCLGIGYLLPRYQPDQLQYFEAEVKDSESRIALPDVLAEVIRDNGDVVISVKSDDEGKLKIAVDTALGTKLRIRFTKNGYELHQGTYKVYKEYRHRPLYLNRDDQ
ncbi:MAG: toll/interleukin-1 receptor domain-containing protein [Bacteroidia bacterium]